jgi:hypothetical protein
VNYIGDINLNVNYFTFCQGLELIKNINHDFWTFIFKILANAQFWSWGHNKWLHLIWLKSFFPREDHLYSLIISLGRQDVIEIVLEPEFSCSHFWNIDECILVLLRFSIRHAGVVQLWEKILFQEITLGTGRYVNLLWRWLFFLFFFWLFLWLLLFYLDLLLFTTKLINFFPLTILFIRTLQ